MILEHIKDMSEKFGETTVKDCTITVPVFWTKAQRISLINAAQAVGLNVLSLIHENVAAAFYYGIDRFDNETDHYALFYNLGSSYLQVSLVKYNTVVTKVSYSNKQIENVVVLAHAYDETLGGSLFDSLLAEYLALKFEEVSKTSVKSVPKAMTRLLTQANIAKKILSANKSTLVIVNNLYKNIDFKYTLTREELENLILPYEERLVKPILKVLEDSGIDKSLVNYLEIIGGGSRIPKVQEIIKEKTGLDISTHLNGDEAMAHGAALYAANFSSTVHVKPIWLSDLSDKIVSAKVYELVSDNLIHEEVIFDTKQRLGAYKELRLATKSNLYIVIEDSTNSTSIVLGKYEINDIASVNVTDYNLSLIFVLDYNAIPFLHKAAAEYEVTLKQLLKKPNFNLLNNSDNSAKINETQLEANTTIEEVWNTQVKSIKLNHQYIDITHPKLPTGENIKTLINNLSNYKQIEKKIKKVAEAKNELESYVYFLSDKSEEEVYASVTSQSERDSLSELLTSVKTWMESSEFSNSDLKDLRDKKSELESFVNSSLVREYELGVRDSSVEKGKNTLDRLESELLLVNQSKPWIPSREFVAAWSKINETREWISNKTYDQGLLELWQDLAFTSKQLEAKVSYAEHLVEKLKRMARPPRVKII
jgi:hypoxia up-regulated 1